MSGFYVNPERGGETFLFGAEVMEWNKIAEFKMPPYFLLFTSPPFYHFARHSLTFKAE